MEPDRTPRLPSPDLLSRLALADARRLQEPTQAAPPQHERPRCLHGNPCGECFDCECPR